ncbi:hypothetical protein [Sagittula sp. SSi028]|uniref:hypothetical protein n=1 Tax=Sagittula sp. SSi028 TaxID=3400636 RepID=UPI003AF53036
MQKPISVLVLSAVILSGCGAVRDSRANPFNWFGNSAPAADRVEGASGNSLIPPQRRSIFRASQDDAYAGSDVEAVTGLFIEPRPGGTLVRARGQTRYQGAHEVRLVQTSPAGSDVLTFALQAVDEPRLGGGSATARTVNAAVWVTNNELAGVSTIRVTGRSNAQTARR